MAGFDLIQKGCLNNEKEDEWVKILLVESVFRIGCFSINLTHEDRAMSQLNQKVLNEIIFL